MTKTLFILGQRLQGNTLSAFCGNCLTLEHGRTHNMVPTRTGNILRGFHISCVNMGLRPLVRVRYIDILTSRTCDGATPTDGNTTSHQPLKHNSTSLAVLTSALSHTFSAAISVPAEPEEGQGAARPPGSLLSLSWALIAR